MARQNIKFTYDYCVYANSFAESGNSIAMTTDYGLHAYELIEDPNCNGIKITTDGKIIARMFLEQGDL